MEQDFGKMIVDMLKNILIVFASLAVLVLYAYVSSAAESRNGIGLSSAAYGMDSLEYASAPVMKIYVWQKNEKTSSSRYLGASSYFYDLVPLPLREGEKLITEKDMFEGPRNPSILITAEYEGEMFGEYEIKAISQIRYSGSKEAVPGVMYEGNSGGKTGSAPVFYQEDASFSANNVLTLDVYPMIGSIVSEKKLGQTFHYGTSLRQNYNVDYNDYLSQETLSTLYPDAPKELRNLYRYVFTTHVTIHAKHPTKSDVIVATAVLKIRQISEWQNTTYEQRALLDELRCYENAHNEVSVVSYEQSDMFAMK